MDVKHGSITLNKVDLIKIVRRLNTSDNHLGLCSCKYALDYILDNYNEYGFDNLIDKAIMLANMLETGKVVYNQNTKILEITRELEYSDITLEN